MSIEEAGAIAGGAPFRHGAEGELTGPMCAVCHQRYVEEGLPCPGRVWGDDDKPRREGLDMLPRAERRQRKLDDRRKQRKVRACEHSEARQRWVIGPQGPKQITECAECGTPLVASSGRVTTAGPPLLSELG